MMISLDWKERLVKDTQDFVQSKLPGGDYAVEIIYNAYPQRIGAHVPKEVVLFVGKKMAELLAKSKDKYVDFYQYLWTHKGENGRLLFVMIMAKMTSRNTDVFLPMLEKIVLATPDCPEISLLLEKVYLPLMSKNYALYYQLLFRWLQVENETFQGNLIKLLVKACKADPKQLEPVFHKLENLWFNASTGMVKANMLFLKSIHGIDPNFYLAVFEKYKSTRDPVIVEILCGSIVCHTPELEAIVENWTHSGHARLKKAAVSGYKQIMRKK